MTETAYWLL